MMGIILNEIDWLVQGSRDARTLQSINVLRYMVLALWSVFRSTGSEHYWNNL